MNELFQYDGIMRVCINRNSCASETLVDIVHLTSLQCNAMLVFVIKMEKGLTSLLRTKGLKDLGQGSLQWFVIKIKRERLSCIESVPLIVKMSGNKIELFLELIENPFLEITF